MLRVGADSSGRLQQRALQQGQGVLSGIGRRVSSLFGILSPPANDTVSAFHPSKFEMESGVQMT